MPQQDLDALARQLGGAPVEAPADLDALAAQMGGSASDVSDEPSVMESQHPHARVGRWVQRNAPMLGGMAASAAIPGAGPLVGAARIAAAAGGGFLGSRARGDDREQAAGEGLTQGAIGLGAGGLQWLAGKAAPLLYQGLLKPATALRDSFGGGKAIAQGLVDEAS